MSNSRSSSNNNSGGINFTPAQLRLKDKQREQAAFQKVLSQSSSLVQFLNEYADTYETLGGGSEGKLLLCTNRRRRRRSRTEC